MSWAGARNLAEPSRGHLRPGDHDRAGEDVRVALAHDYLTQRGGAERVALVLTQVFPGSELVTTVYDPDATYPEFKHVNLKLSFLNRSKQLRRHFRLGLPFYGLAFDHTPTTPGADVVIASSTGFAHGVRADAPKIVYCHSPARFLYLVDDYLGEPWWRTPVGWALMALRPALIRWDRRAAHSAALYLCNSTLVQRRIKDVYGIDARVVHPPAALDPAGPLAPIAEVRGWDRYYLVVSRLMPYKNVDVVIDAFRDMPERRCLVIGRGPLGSSLRANLPANVVMVEGLSDDQMRWAYSHAAAVIAPSREDFGLTPVEGFSFGVPALALRAGGYLDTVQEGVCGWFFDDATAQAIRSAIERLASHPIAHADVLARAQEFTPQAFGDALRAAIAEVVAN